MPNPGIITISSTWRWACYASTSRATVSPLRDWYKWFALPRLRLPLQGCASAWAITWKPSRLRASNLLSLSSLLSLVSLSFPGVPGVVGVSGVATVPCVPVVPNVVIAFAASSSVFRARARARSRIRKA
jgi:hypothetical protein